MARTKETRKGAVSTARNLYNSSESTDDFVTWLVKARNELKDKAQDWIKNSTESTLKNLDPNIKRKINSLGNMTDKTDLSKLATSYMNLHDFFYNSRVTNTGAYGSAKAINDYESIRDSYLKSDKVSDNLKREIENMDIKDFSLFHDFNSYARLTGMKSDYEYKVKLTDRYKLNEDLNRRATYVSTREHMFDFLMTHLNEYGMNKEQAFKWAEEHNISKRKIEDYKSVV